MEMTLSLSGDLLVPILSNQGEMTSPSDALKEIELSLKRNDEESSVVKAKINRLGESAPDYMHKELLALREERNVLLRLQLQGAVISFHGNSKIPCRLPLP